MYGDVVTNFVATDARERSRMSRMAEKRHAITMQLGSTRELFDQEEQRHRSGVQRRTPVDHHAPLVLLVDDQPARRELIAQMIERIYRVREADDAPTAIALCAQEIPDVVVSAATIVDTSGQRLSRLLELALGSDAPPMVVLLDDEGRAPAAEELVLMADRPGDAISLVTMLESAIARAKESDPGAADPGTV
jgi:PleD family two-component response regulator